MGIGKYQSRARQEMYWPNLNEEIHKIISTCDCINKKQQKIATASTRCTCSTMDEMEQIYLLSTEHTI